MACLSSENFCQVFCHAQQWIATFSASGISFLSSHNWHAKPVPLILGSGVFFFRSTPLQGLICGFCYSIIASCIKRTSKSQSQYLKTANAIKFTSHSTVLCREGWGRVWREGTLHRAVRHEANRGSTIFSAWLPKVLWAWISSQQLEEDREHGQSHGCFRS